MTALDAVCDSVGCSWRLESGPPRILRLRPRKGGQKGDAAALPLTVQFQDLSRIEALKRLASKAGLEVQVKGTLIGSVAMRMEGVTLGTALQALCEPAGCHWSLDRERPSLLNVIAREITNGAPGGSRSKAEELKEKLQLPLTLSLREASSAVVLRSFGNVLGCRVEVDPKVDGTVTVELQDISVAQAMDQVCSQMQCRWRLERKGPTVTLIFEKKEAFPSPATSPAGAGREAMPNSSRLRPKLAAT